ncbi:MAG: TonB-dependent receptor [Acidobacteria bacterium]|nr:TonB-dependent receptor [Acidobacteriota bacterium]
MNIHSARPAWRYFNPAFFAQDDIKVTPRLTVNLGLRYEIPFPRTEAHNILRGFDPTVPNPDPLVQGTRLGAIVGAGGQGGLQASSRSLVNTDYTDVAPRVGFAYSLTGRSVVRGGIGLYYAPLLSSDIVSGLAGYNPGCVPPTCPGSTPNGRQSTSFLSTMQPAPVPNPGGQFIGTDVDYFNPNFKEGRTLQYSLDYQHELAKDWAFTVGYIGAHGTRLRSGFKRMNALPLADLKLGFPLLSEPLSAALSDANAVAYASSVGVTLPSSLAAVYPGFNGSVAQALRPFPQYGTVNQQLEDSGRSLYNALNVKVDKRFGYGLQFGLAYTFSKLITDASENLLDVANASNPLGNVVQNPYDIRSIRTVSPNNPAHVIVFNYVYELPFGRGKRFATQSGALNKIIGGWQFNGIQRYQSGLPISVLNSDPLYTDQFLNLVGFGGSIRPNLTGAPILASAPVTGLSYQLLNPAAFASPTPFNSPTSLGTIGSPAYATYYADPNVFFGNAPPVISKIRVLPYYSENLSLLKRTGITERFNLEFRTEIFNPFNRHRYFQPYNDLRDSGNFGKAAVVDQPYVYDPRVIQFGLKLIY